MGCAWRWCDRRLRRARRHGESVRRERALLQFFSLVVNCVQRLTVGLNRVMDPRKKEVPRLMTTRESYSKGSGMRLFVNTLALMAVLGIAFPGWSVRADTITDDNVEAALKSAKTAADHQALAEYFTAKSKEAQTNVETHK